MKGLPVDIYRNAYSSELNKMHGKQSATLIGVTELFEPVEDAPAIRIVKRNLFGKEYCHAEPLEPGTYAFGGSFVYTSDSRFRDLFPYPLPLHDRQMNLEK